MTGCTGEVDEDPIAAQLGLGAAASEWGASCTASAGCATSASLVCVRPPSAATGVCGCANGLTACGTRCVDLGRDPRNCGMCGVDCPRGTRCIEGACGGGGVTILAPTTPVQISGGDPATVCLGTTEGVPERSLNGQFAERFFVSHNGDAAHWNWGDAWNHWDNPIYPYVLPSYSDPSESYTTIGDTWTTTSGGTGLEYVSTVVYDDSSPADHYLGIAATESWNLDVGYWHYPARPITAAPTGSDGPAIHFDYGAPVLWAAEIAYDETGHPFKLHVMYPCLSGPPGESSSGCPLAATVTIPGPITVHPNVVANPCTHHGVAGWIDSSNQVMMAFYNVDGSPAGVGMKLVDTVRARRTVCGAPPDTCAAAGPDGQVCKCGGRVPDPVLGSCAWPGSEDRCIRLAQRVQMATKYVESSGQCLLALSYDTTRKTNDVGWFWKNRIQIWDITNESAPYPLAVWQSSGDGAARNEYMGTVSYPFYSAKGFGWFYYSQVDGDPCRTVYTGWTSKNLGLSMWTVLTSISAGEFPSIQGQGEYVGNIPLGLPSGYMFPSWTEPVTPGPSGCLLCMGNNYSFSVRGVRLLP